MQQSSLCLRLTLEIVAVRWAVESNAAVSVTKGTFEAMRANPGIGRAEALRCGTLATMNDRSVAFSAHPAYWGAFSVVGDGQRQ